MPSIDRSSSVPFYQQVYEQIARGIESGVYPAGKKLPSIRESARELGVSNTTIELAYQRLSEEGYVEARRGSGYTICKVDLKPAPTSDRFTDEYHRALSALMQRESKKEPIPTYDFAYDSVDASLFPFTAWARICREVFFTPESGDACLYNDGQGLRSLREQIAFYLASEYGLSCRAEQILVKPTTRDLVSEVIALFDPATTVVAMGNPGYDEVAKRLLERGYVAREIPTYPYPSWDVVEEALEGVNVVFATPACQFPTNQSMPSDIRHNLVNWANEHGAYIIDDEYCWEFQPSFERVPSLSALDEKGNVIALCTFSNSFTPAVCLSYAVLPPQLMMKWQDQHRGSHPQVPWQTQAAMTTFMRSDNWRTHIRKTRTAIARKRQALANAIDEYLGDNVQVIKGTCSLFALIQTNDGRSERELIEAAANEGIRVYPTSQYWRADAPADWRYVLVGYACTPMDDIDPGIKALARAWGFQGNTSS